MATLELRRQRFKSLRKKFNITQRQLSIDLDVTESHIRNIEAGRGNPDAKLLFIMANYFETTPEYLFPDLANMSVKRSFDKHPQSIL